MKKIMALFLALSCIVGTLPAFAADDIYEADAYVIFSDTIESKNIKFFDGGQDDPYALMYNEKVVLEGEEARKVYGYAPTVNYVYMQMDESFYDVEEDHDFFIDLRFYQFGPGAATFRLQYPTETATNTLTIRKEAEVMWVTKRIHVTDAYFNHSIDDVGADIKIISGAFNAFAFMTVKNAKSIRTEPEYDVGQAEADRAKSMYDMGLYVPDGDDYTKNLATDLTKAKTAKMIVKIIGKEAEIEGCTTLMTGASDEESKALGYLEKNNYIDWSGDAQATLTQEELVEVFCKIQGVVIEDDIFDSAIAAGLIKTEDLILQPAKNAVENNLLRLGYNWLHIADDSGEKNAMSLVKKNLVSGDKFEKDVYYEKYIDDYSGLPVEFFDFGKNALERIYFTQTYWLNDGSALVVGDISERKLYKYTLDTHEVEPLHGDDIKCNDFGITENNMMYMRNIAAHAKDRMQYSIDLNEPLKETISATVNAEGTAFEGDLVFGGEAIAFSGKDSSEAVEGKAYSYNSKPEDSWYFNIPDDFLYGKYSENVEIEVEYFAPDGKGKLALSVNSDDSKYTAPVEADGWITKRFVIKEDDGKGSGFSNGFNGVSDIKLMFEDCCAYVRKVSVTKHNNNVKWLAERPQGNGYLVQTTRDGKFYTLTGENDPYTIVLHDVEKNEWQTMTFEDFFGPGSNRTTHVMINPVYPNLILFCHEGGAKEDFDRLWLHDTETGTYKNIYRQYQNLKNVMEGEKVGHESWLMDGETIVTVKYRESPSIGRMGITRINKYGDDREYVNDDYDFWHCHPSPDGRWVVADTKIDSHGKGRIILIDCKTGKSHVVAYPKIGVQDPNQPHAQFSADGKKINFTTTRRSVDGQVVYGCAIVDVSSIVDDGQHDVIYEGTNGRAGYRVSPFEFNLVGETGNEVTTHVKKLDDTVKDLSLVAVAYDENGKLLSVGMNGCTTDVDTTLTTKFDWPEGAKTLRCFMVDDKGGCAKTYPTAVEKLRAARTEKNNIVLTWTSSQNLIDEKYTIYRNGVKLGETSDNVFRDANLEPGSELTYEVIPSYNKNGYITAGDECVTIKPVYVDGKLTCEAPDSSIEAPAAWIELQTDYETVSYNLGKDTGVGMQLWTTEDDNTLDHYTEKTTVEGVDCRTNIMQTVDGAESPSMFYFRVDRNSISRRIRDVELEVKYYSYAPGGGDLYLEYNSINEGKTSNKTIKIASLVSNSALGKWKTEKIIINDAYLDTFEGLKRCDFRFKSTNSGVCISDVSVTNNNDSPSSDRQFIEWNTKETNGIEWLGGGKAEGDYRYISKPGEYLKFDVDDTYMYGTNMNMAWIDVSYLDVGTDEIYLEYNSSDPTATALQKPCKPAEVIKCTNTGEIKTKRFELIDVNFSGLQGYDFRIGTNNTAYISDVRILGY